MKHIKQSLIRYRRQPLGVIRLPATHGLKVDALQFLCNRTPNAVTDRPVIELPYRDDLRRGAGKKCLIGDIDFISGNALLFYGQTMIRCDAQYAVSGNALET